MAGTGRVFTADDFKFSRPVFHDNVKRLISAGVVKVCRPSVHLGHNNLPIQFVGTAAQERGGKNLGPVSWVGVGGRGAGYSPPVLRAAEL
jgi:hypothetical protein